jgi:hypothetical protein
LLILCLCVSGFGQSGPPPLPHVPLEYWALNRTNWEGWRQEPPLGFTNLNAVPSWLNFALSVDTNTTACLNLPIYAVDGYTNVVFDSGSICFWCQATWTSSADGGAGPGAWVPLWQAGTYSTTNQGQLQRQTGQFRVGLAGKGERTRHHGRSNWKLAWRLGF